MEKIFAWSPINIRIFPFQAVDEPSFSVAYAQMCRTLQKMEVPSDQVRHADRLPPDNFRKLLLNRCQQEFEKNIAAELNRDDRLKEIDEEKDPVNFISRINQVEKK